MPLLFHPHHKLSLSPPLPRHRRRVKSPKYPCHVISSFDSIISQIPSLSQNSLLSLAPLIGFASGFAIYLSNNKKVNSLVENDGGDERLGEWILMSSPTPFNRFVILRCGSICVEGGGVNERLVKEERHFVRLSSGGMRVMERGSSKDLSDLVYRRVCVGVGDGGVIGVDWPEELELEEERGLDTTVVIVPGTGEGSGEGCVREFVSECLRRGCFPVVVNPRGCGGSPLTTPR